MTFTIDMDGRRLTAESGETLLEVARRAGIDIPTLCHHEALPPFGACRLCVVEVHDRTTPGSKRLVTACEHPAAEGQVVETRSERVMRARRDVVDLLLARAPDSPVIRELAASYGLDQTTFEPDVDRDDCILCGLCTRICAHLGHSAIETLGRGADSHVGSPLEGPPPDCVGCAACAHVCPTHNIPVRERDGKRVIWDREFEMHRCSECGRAYITRFQMSHRVANSGLDESFFELCDECSRRKVAKTMLENVL